MESFINGRWIIPFMKFGMVRVKKDMERKLRSGDSSDDEPFYLVYIYSIHR